jgi:hypothetical protein
MIKFILFLFGCAAIFGGLICADLFRQRKIERKTLQFHEEMIYLEKLIDCSDVDEETAGYIRERFDKVRRLNINSARVKRLYDLFRQKFVTLQKNSSMLNEIK